MSAKYLTINEVSEITRVPVSTLHWYRHKGTGGPKSFRLGKRVLYAVEDVEAWIDEARAGEEAKAGGAA